MARLGLLLTGGSLTLVSPYRMLGDSRHGHE